MSDDEISYKLSSDFEAGGNHDKKEKKKKKKEANKVLLSFGGDENEEGPEFVVKKTKPKQSLAELEAAQKKAKHKSSRPSKANPDIANGKPLLGAKKSHEHSNLRSSAGEYTKDKLHALKGNAIHLSSSVSSGNGSNSGGSSKKTSTTEKIDMEALGESVRSILEDDDDGGFDPKMRRVDDARRKRAIARTVGEENFIPLGVASTALQPIHKSKAEKRLEEDEDDMAGEYLESYTNNQRIMFGDPNSERHKKQREEEKRREFSDRRPKKVVVDAPASASFISSSQNSSSNSESNGSSSSAKVSVSSSKQTSNVSDSSKKNRVSVLIDSDSSGKEDDDSEEESFRRWENEQIKKGAGATYVVEKKEKPVATANATPAQAAPQQLSAPAPRAKITVDSIRAKMTGHISDLKEQAARRSRELEAAGQELEGARKALAGLQVDMARSNQQYQFFQQVRDHIADVLDCATSKIPLIEKHHDRMVVIQKAYSKALEMHLSLNAADLQREAFSELRTEEVKGKDEFGREISDDEHMRPKRDSMRAARRARRTIKEPEGWSTDEEGLESFEAQRAAVREEAKRTFEDVTDDYQTIDHIQGIMENWKKEYPAAYADAFISLSLPALFAPYMRIEALCWQPLTRPHFDSLPSYQKLFSFGEEEEDGQDANLLPKLLANIAVPHVCNIILYQYNPLSSKQTSKMVEIMKECFSHLEDNTASMSDLNKALFTRLAKSVHAHSDCKVVPAWKSTDPETESLIKQMEFCRMRCWKAIKLLGNVLQFYHTLEQKGDLGALAASHASDSIAPFLVWLLEKEENCQTTGGIKLAESLNQQLAVVDPAKDGKSSLVLLKQNITKLLGAKPQSSAYFIAVGSLKEMSKRS